jgi:hypothetical protein
MHVAFYFRVLRHKKDKHGIYFPNRDTILEQLYKTREEYRLWVFENRVLRRIFGPKKRDEVTRGCRKLHNEELHNLYSSPSRIIRVIKSRRMRWAELVARIARRGMHIGYWWESQKERDQ